MEANNNARLREALTTIRKRLVAAYESEACFMLYSPNKPLVDLIDSALAAPPRNCDVGTAEEQYERYRKRCGAQDCCDCPVRARWDFKQTGSESCQLVWAQMSYEEGGAK